jgi:hypothetical protein
MRWIASEDRSPGWYLQWFAAVGTCLSGLTFFFGSLVALRDRRRAGVVFLSVMPLAAFCMAYPDSGFLVWRDGGGWFETPLPATAIELAALFWAPFLAPLCLWRHRKWAIVAFAVATSALVLVFAQSRWPPALVPRLVGWSVPFLIPGLFWLRTARLGWPPLLEPRPRTPLRRVANFTAVCAGVPCLAVVSTLTQYALGSGLWSPDCSGRRPFTHPQSAIHAVFTAKVLLAGRSLHDLRHDVWAIGIIQERFWGMPHWTRLVLLTNFIYRQGETYFVDGRRDLGLISQFFPVVEGGIICSRTRPVQEALVDMRILHKPAAGTRLIGYVRGPEPFVTDYDRPVKPAFVAGAQFEVSGPGGIRTVTTDSSGLYDLDGLAPGDYTMHLLVPDTLAVGSYDGEGSLLRVHLNSGDLEERNFRLFWDGRIEGHVREAGKATRAWVALVRPDGSSIPGLTNFPQQTAPDGSYGFHEVPPGRYALILNPDGPRDESPYDRQRHPSSFQLSGGQHITGIDFTALRLPERQTEVLVKWSNGQAVEGAQVYAAYENTGDYQTLAGTICCWNTDHKGAVAIRTYGRSQVRIFAKHGLDEFHSRPRQFAADGTPERVDLVLRSQ